MIDLRIRKQFPEQAHSRAFTLDLALRTEARCTVLFGPSGAGKSLTLDAIAGLVRPDSGRILAGDRLLFDSEAPVCLPPQKRNCGYVFQDCDLFPHLTLRQNLDFAAARLPRLERRRRVNEMIELFHLAGEDSRHPHQLSGGQRQRGAIARALLAAPRLLLLDEPARGLDPSLRAGFYHLLRQVREEFSLPVVLVTHDLDECFALGEFVAVLAAGRLLQTGAPSDVLDQPASAEVARLLGRANLLAVEVVALDPVQRTSRLRVQPELGPAFEFAGPYLPGRLLGDRLTLAVRADQVAAEPAAGSPPPGAVRLELDRISPRPQTVRLHFRGGLVAELPRGRFDAARPAQQWNVSFPPEAFRVVK